MVQAEQIGEIRRAADAPTGAAALHAVADECKYVAFHTAQPRMVDRARLAGFRNRNAAVVSARQPISVAFIITPKPDNSIVTKASNAINFFIVLATSVSLFYFLTDLRFNDVKEFVIVYYCNRIRKLRQVRGISLLLNKSIDVFRILLNDRQQA